MAYVEMYAAYIAALTYFYVLFIVRAFIFKFLIIFCEFRFKLCCPWLFYCDTLFPFIRGIDLDSSEMLCPLR